MKNIQLINRIIENKDSTNNKDISEWEAFRTNIFLSFTYFNNPALRVDGDQFFSKAKGIFSLDSKVLDSETSEHNRRKQKTFETKLAQDINSHIRFEYGYCFARYPFYTNYSLGI